MSRRGDAVFLTNFLGAHYLIAASVSGTEDVCMLSNQLSVVLIGCEHIAFYSDGIGFFC